MNLKWHKRFLNVAKTISIWSKDQSTQVGAVIVGPDREIRSTGFNGFPRGINDNVIQRHKRPIKYLYTSHAEQNAISQAARIGVSTKNCSIYIYSAPSCLPPCADCARYIIQAGISEVIYCQGEIAEHWKENTKIALSMLDEAKIKHIKIKL